MCDSCFSPTLGTSGVSSGHLSTLLPQGLKCQLPYLENSSVAVDVQGEGAVGASIVVKDLGQCRRRKVDGRRLRRVLRDLADVGVASERRSLVVDVLLGQKEVVAVQLLDSNGTIIEWCDLELFNGPALLLKK